MPPINVSELQKSITGHLVSQLPKGFNKSDEKLVGVMERFAAAMVDSLTTGRKKDFATERSAVNSALLESRERGSSARSTQATITAYNRNVLDGAVAAVEKTNGAQVADSQLGAFPKDLLGKLQTHKGLSVQPEHVNAKKSASEKAIVTYIAGKFKEIGAEPNSKDDLVSQHGFISPQRAAASYVQSFAKIMTGLIQSGKQKDAPYDASSIKVNADHLAMQGKTPAQLASVNAAVTAVANEVNKLNGHPSPAASASVLPPDVARAMGEYKAIVIARRDLGLESPTASGTRSGSGSPSQTASVSGTRTESVTSLGTSSQTASVSGTMTGTESPTQTRSGSGSRTATGSRPPGDNTALSAIVAGAMSVISGLKGASRATPATSGAAVKADVAKAPGKGSSPVVG